jgi:two-component system C4-dicarboxylate transport sensor histidine kinase DctB
MENAATSFQTGSNKTPLLVRLGLLVLFIAACLVIWLSNLYLTERYTQSTRENAEKQVNLYSGRIISELQRASVVPLLLSRDNFLVTALNSTDFVNASQRLISYQDEIGAKAIVLLDNSGRVVAASDRRELGSIYRDTTYFIDALRADDTVFSTQGLDEGAVGFFFSRRLESEKELIGVVVVEVDLEPLFDRWSSSQATIIVTNSSGKIILSTERQFVHQTLDQALDSSRPRSAVERAIRATGDWTDTLGESYLTGQQLFQLDTKIPFQGWQLSYLTSFDAVRARVNSSLALEITAMAILSALVFYVLSRRAIRQSFLFKAESQELRALNERLSAEITERARVEANLRVAEQSLEQSSKLAALGEMSAAVSHELNQPLAAMRTYLAGAKLLLQRSRPDEAVSSFQRIDDLIDRMGAITKQLKSHARKGGEELTELDFRNAVNAALSMMSPQLSKMLVEINIQLPKTPVMILADQLRLEQVIVNILRNALDAVRAQESRKIDILMVEADYVTLYIQDNGPGIENMDDMFEPFFTTKRPGEGLGLGLAISSGIAKDLGGRLIARNRPSGGAEFEFQLPGINTKDIKAAE